MKPGHWLDLIDLLTRLLTILRRVLSDIWDNDDQATQPAV
jgi:hypothetical protein